MSLKVGKGGRKVRVMCERVCVCVREVGCAASHRAIFEMRASVATQDEAAQALLSIIGGVDDD